MRTIAVAVAILCACFMQEVSGLKISRKNKPEVVTQDAKLHLTEKKEEKLEELDVVGQKLAATADERHKDAAKAGVSDEVKKAADQQVLAMKAQVLVDQQVLGMEAKAGEASKKHEARTAVQLTNEANIVVLSEDEDEEDDEEDEEDEDDEDED